MSEEIPETPVEETPEVDPMAIPPLFGPPALTPAMLSLAGRELLRTTSSGSITYETQPLVIQRRYDQHGKNVVMSNLHYIEARLLRSIGRGADREREILATDNPVAAQQWERMSLWLTALADSIDPDLL